MKDRTYELDNLTRTQWLQVYAMWMFTVACIIRMM
jgi:hypothetical protein